MSASNLLVALIGGVGLLGAGVGLLYWALPGALICGGLGIILAFVGIAMLAG